MIQNPIIEETKPTVTTTPEHHPLEVVDTEQQAETGADGEGKEDADDSTTTKVPDFAGEITVKFPETEKEFTFTPLQTTRGKMELRWSYPSPQPGVRKDRKPEEALTKYAELLGVEGVLESVEESINRTCQNKWRQAVADCKDSSKLGEYFATIFHEGRTRESITPEGFIRKANDFQKKAMEEKSKPNADMALVKSLVQQAREAHAKAQELLQAQMLALDETTK